MQNPLVSATLSIDRSLTSSSRWASWTRWLHQPLVRRGSGRGQEPAGERSGTHRRPDGQILDRHRLVEMLLHPGNRVREQVGAVQHGQRLLDVLGLAAVALRRDDQLAGELGGDLAPVVLADDVQAEVDAGGTARAGEDVALVDEEHPGVDRQERISAGQLVALGPVGRRAPPVEQSRLRRGRRRPRTSERMRHPRACASRNASKTGSGTSSGR